MNDNFYILVVLSVAGTGIIVAGFILVQVRNHKRILQKQQQLAAAEIQHQKILLEAVITSQEEERKRIGSDLHDEVGTLLSSLRMLIEKHKADAAPGFSARSKEMIDQVIKNVRRISHNLSPHISGSFGLYDAIYELADTVVSLKVMAVKLDFRETDIPDHLDTQRALAIYRVLAELINNTIKHAHASGITIRITTEHNGLRVQYADDGTGFDYIPGSNNNGIGMKNIESRMNMIGADLVISSSLNKGFTAEIAVPLS